MFESSSVDSDLSKVPNLECSNIHNNKNINQTTLIDEESEWLAIKPFDRQASLNQDMLNIVSISIEKDKVIYIENILILAFHSF